MEWYPSLGQVYVVKETDFVSREMWDENPGFPFTINETVWEAALLNISILIHTLKIMLYWTLLTLYLMNKLGTQNIVSTYNDSYRCYLS